MKIIINYNQQVEDTFSSRYNFIGDHGNPTQSAKNPTTSDKPSDNRLPNELPKDQTTIFINGEPVPIIPYNNSMCWPNISRTFWHSMIYTQGEKSAFGKNFKRLRCRYDELTKNVTDHIMQIIYAVNELSNLLQSNVDRLEFNIPNSLLNYKNILGSIMLFKYFLISLKLLW